MTFLGLGQSHQFSFRCGNELGIFNNESQGCSYIKKYSIDLIYGSTHIQTSSTAGSAGVL